MDLSQTEQFFRIASYAATPFIAAAAAFIAYQQYRVNELKLKLDQYDRRLKIYTEVRNLLRIVMRDANVKDFDAVAFRSSVAEADFLFGPEITKYLDEVYSHVVDLGMWSSMYRDSTQEQPPDYDHQKVVKSKHEALRWLTSQYEPALAKFKPYLTLMR
jgi:hypothetical protein